MTDYSECAHEQWSCVGDHGVVCADCGYIIVDGRTPEAILAEQVNSLRAEVSALRKDAERYRYCREGGYLDFCFGADPTDATVDEEMVKYPRAAAP